MMRYRIPIYLLATALLIPSAARAQISEVEVKSLGLETAWVSQARVPAYGNGIVSAELWVDETATQKVAVAELPDRSLVRVYAHKLDAKNQPIGMEQAKAETQAIAAKLLGKPTGFEVAEVVVPAIKLVVVSATGLVQNFDAETGKLLWSTPCGPMNTTALPGALSAAGVIVVQGDNLYLLDWLTGKQLMVKHLPNSTSTAVVAIDGKIDPPVGVQRNPRINSMAMVSDFSGNLIAYGLSDKISPWSSRMPGRANSRPGITPDRQMIAISTTAGMVYFFDGADRPNVKFRYEARGGLTDSLAVGKDAFYVGGIDGSLVKVSFAGQIVWTFSLPNAIISPAMVDQEHGLVFVSTESGELTAIDDVTGFEAWSYPARANIRGPVSLCGPSLICRTTDDRLVAFDKKTGMIKVNASGGSSIAGTSSSQTMLPAMLINTMTDRVYVASRNGRLQCLRPTGRVIPTVFKPIIATATSPEEAPVAAETPMEESTGAALDANPFAEPMEPAADGGAALFDIP